jgi:putative ABC transport system substrate-binding protein
MLRNEGRRSLIGDVTGSAVFGSEIVAKRLEILKEALPHIARIGILWNTANAGYASVLKSIKEGGRRLNVEVEFFDLREAGQLESVIESVVKARIDAVATVPDTLFTQNAKVIAETLIRKSLPSIGTNWFGELGGMLGYGPDENNMYRRAATYVDKILNGAKPGDLPFERPTQFEMVVNQKTAKALGITIPPEIMVRATRVIQ